MRKVFTTESVVSLDRELHLPAPNQTTDTFSKY